MRKLKFGWRALLVVPFLLMSHGVFAGTSAQAEPDFPAGPLKVGQVNIPVRLVITVGGDVFPLTAVDNKAFITMSCGTATTPWNCSGTKVDLGVFQIADRTAVEATGAGICDGEFFDFSVEDANGETTITPTDGTFPPFNSPGEVCVINFLVNVKKVPSVDAGDPTPLGAQTVQGGQIFLAGGLLPAEGSGADSLTIDPPDCSVQVDKQVKCGDADWVDVGYGDTELPVACQTLDANMVDVRYLVKNPESACPLTKCNLVESNAVFGAAPGTANFALANGQEITVDASEQVCSTAYKTGDKVNEPNKIMVECENVLGQPETDDDEAAFSCLSVALLVDRNVDCDGDGLGPQDMTLTADNTDPPADPDGTHGCTTRDDEEVNWGYQSCNDGTAPLYDCTLVDSNTDVSIPIVVGDLAANSCDGVSNKNVATKNPLLCSTDLEADEAANGKVTLTCCTKDGANIAACATADRVSVFDKSDVTCQTPSTLEITKACVDDDPDGSGPLGPDGTDDGTSVVVTATSGDLGFTGCVVTDKIYLGSPTCDPLLGAGTDVTLTNASYALAPGGDETSTGDFVPALEADACNTASVTCLDYAGASTDPIDAAPVICDFVADGCITHSPGYWGTHPNAAAALLDIEVCGKTLDSVDPGSKLTPNQSTTEAICSVGQDGKILGDQVTQLVRQCTAARLNEAVTLAEEGGCTHAQEKTIDDCCSVATGAGNYCSAQDAGNSLGVSACITLLDEFNNSPDTKQSDWFDDYNPADSSLCNASKNNGYHPFKPNYVPPPKPGKGK